MTDRESNSVDAAAYLAREHGTMDLDPPTKSDLQDRGDTPAPGFGHSGPCTICGAFVSTRTPGGVCSYQGGPCHPACRDEHRGGPARG